MHQQCYAELQFLILFSVTCGVPRPQIKAACSHPLVLLQQPNDKATKTKNHMIKIVKAILCT